jgi:hypothetical protein
LSLLSEITVPAAFPAAIVATPLGVHSVVPLPAGAPSPKVALDWVVDDWLDA